MGTAIVWSCRDLRITDNTVLAIAVDQSANVVPVAGSGARGPAPDAAPYFRILNPWTQTARFDSKGDYVKTWIPELRDVAPERFAEPPPAGQRLSRHYPGPIVDHAQASIKALEIFGQYKKYKAGVD